MKLSKNLEYTQNFALPTGRPEITEILREQEPFQHSWDTKSLHLGKKYI